MYKSMSRRPNRKEFTEDKYVRCYRIIPLYVYVFSLSEQHDQCLQKRRNTLVKQHHNAELFLEKMRENKLKDLKIWKQKHAWMRERHEKQVRSDYWFSGKEERIWQYQKCSEYFRIACQIISLYGERSTDHFISNGELFVSIENIVVVIVE